MSWGYNGVASSSSCSSYISISFDKTFSPILKSKHCISKIQSERKTIELEIFSLCDIFSLFLYTITIDQITLLRGETNICAFPKWIIAPLTSSQPGAGGGGAISKCSWEPCESKSFWKEIIHYHNKTVAPRQNSVHLPNLPRVISPHAVILTTMTTIWRPQCDWGKMES